MSHSKKVIKFLQRHWDGAVVVKGVQFLEDAGNRVKIRRQAIVVSNCCVRQADVAVRSSDMGSRLVEAIVDRTEAFFESGVRCEADRTKDPCSRSKDVSD